MLTIWIVPFLFKFFQIIFIKKNSFSGRYLLQKWKRFEFFLKIINVRNIFNVCINYWFCHLFCFLAKPFCVLLLNCFFFHLYCGCLSSSIAFLDSIWFLSELRLDEDLKVWEVWDDDLINSLNSALRDTGSNLIVRKTFQMLTLSPLYCALYSCICYMSLEISPSRTIQKS